MTVYFAGDRLMLADITFAVAGAPLVLPWVMVAIQASRGRFRRSIRLLPRNEMRDTRADQRVLRLYREECYPARP